MKTETRSDLERVRSLLATIIRLKGMDRQTLDRNIGEGRGFTSQVIVGRVKLRFEHVLEMLDGLDLTPALFFSLLYPIPPGDRKQLALLSDLIERLRLEGFEVSPPPAPAPPAPDDEEIARIARAAVEKALRESKSSGQGPRRSQGKRS